MKHQDDGKFVVVEGNQRVSGQLHEKKESAQAEADKVKSPAKQNESQGQATGPKVAQNLYG